MNDDDKIYEFGAFRFLPSENLLLREGEVIALPPKAIGVLTQLVGNHGHVVSKDVLIRSVWEGRIVEESTVSRNVWLVRQALCDDPRNCGYIQTVPKIGYRFVAEVRHIRPEKADRIHGNEDREFKGDTASETTISSAASKDPDEFLRNYRRLPITAVSVVLLAAAIASYFYLVPKSALSDGTRSIAVLPFRPIGSGSRDGLLEIGFADSLINRLTANKVFVVRPLSAIRKYSETEQDPIAAGREQKVDYVLVSNYQLADGRIRVTTQLFNVPTGQVDETYKFEMSATDAFAVQDAVAAEIGNQFFERFGAEKAGRVGSRGTENEEAYRYYLLAQNFNELRGVENGRIALEQIDRAVALDPNFARAWATKAYIHRYMGYGSLAIEHSLRSMEAVEKAIALDPNLSEAHSVLCFNKFRFEYDFAAAERACKRAIELDPSSPLAHKLYSNFLYTRGRFDESLSEIKKAIDLQPVSYDNQQTYGLALYFARRYAESEAQWKELIPLNPNHNLIYVHLISSLVQQGKQAEAFENFIKLLDLEKTDDNTIQRFRAIYSRSGWKEVIAERIRILESRGNARSYDLARLYASINDKDNALKFLDRAFQERSNMIAVLGVDPELDTLRNDPRFDALLKRIGLNEL